MFQNSFCSLFLVRAVILSKKVDDKMNIDYSKECLVIFVFSNDNGESFAMHYRRPQDADNLTLNLEAEKNAEDMIEKSLNGAKELIAIGIARSQEEHEEIEKQLRGE